MRVALVLLCLLASPGLADEGYLRYLPADTKVVLTVHVGRLSAAERERGQTMVRQLYQAHLCPALDKDDPLPLRELEQVVLALPYAGTFNGVLLIRGKIDRKRLEEQMSQAARAGGAVSVETMGKPPVPVFKVKLDEKVLLGLAPGLGKIPGPVRKLVAPQSVHVAVLDDNTLIASLSGESPVTRALRARPEKSALRISTELAKLLRQPHKTDLGSLVVMDDSLHPGLQLISDESTKETFDQFEHVRLHVRAGKTIEVETVAQGKSSDLGPILEKKARRVLEVIRKELPNVMRDKTRRAAIDELVKSFRVERKDGQITIKGSMTEADGKKFIEGDKKDR